MEFREIAKELAVACLSHEHFAGGLRSVGADKAHAAATGENVGEFYNAILKALLKEASASSKGPTAHQF